MLYNEELIAPYLFGHYADIDHIIVLYETDSDDRTLDICKQWRNVTVKPIHITGGIDDDQKINLLNEEIGNQEGKSDWVYVVDSDEFIFPFGFEDPYKFLERQKNYDVVMACMYQVYRHVTDKDLDPQEPAVGQRIHGDLDLMSTESTPYQDANIHYCKPVVMRPGKVTLEVGNHNFSGNAPRICSSDLYVGAHWCHADPSIALRRRMLRTQRMSQVNKDKGYGWQDHNTTIEAIIDLCESHKNDPMIGYLC